jgi:hypothetical protein
MRMTSSTKARLERLENSLSNPTFGSTFVRSIRYKVFKIGGLASPNVLENIGRNIAFHDPRSTVPLETENTTKFIDVIKAA